MLVLFLFSRENTLFTKTNIFFVILDRQNTPSQYAKITYAANYDRRESHINKDFVTIYYIKDKAVTGDHNPSYNPGKNQWEKI